MWELDGWDGLAANFAHETGGGKDQDPSLAEWWATAASLRRGGVDRIVVPEPWTRAGRASSIADGVRGELYAHELVTVPVGTVGEYLDALASEGRAAVEALGLEGGGRLPGRHGQRLRGDRASGRSRTGPPGPASSRRGADDGELARRGARRRSTCRPTGAASSSSTRRSARSASAASPRSPTASPWTRSVDRFPGLGSVIPNVPER